MANLAQEYFVTALVTTNKLLKCNLMSWTFVGFTQVKSLDTLQQNLVRRKSIFLVTLAMFLSVLIVAHFLFILSFLFALHNGFMRFMNQNPTIFHVFISVKTILVISKKPWSPSNENSIFVGVLGVFAHLAPRHHHTAQYPKMFSLLYFLCCLLSII